MVICYLCYSVTNDGTRGLFIKLFACRSSLTGSKLIVFLLIKATFLSFRITMRLRDECFHLKSKSGKYPFCKTRKHKNAPM